MTIRNLTVFWRVVIDGGVECRVRDLVMKRNGIGKEADRGGLL
jgi:hypothetical protein